MIKTIKNIKINNEEKNIENKIKITIASDFSDAVGVRTREEGPFSGQQFYEDILSSKFEKAINENKKVWIDFDGTCGYPPSFISSAFGRLSDKFGKNVGKYLEIKTTEDGFLQEKIETAIEEGNE